MLKLPSCKHRGTWKAYGTEFRRVCMHPDRVEHHHYCYAMLTFLKDCPERLTATRGSPNQRKGPKTGENAQNKSN